MTHLVFQHQDGDFSFLIEKAAYHICEEGLFHCWVFTKDHLAQDFIPDPCFGLMRYPLDGDALMPGQVMEIAHRQSDRASLDAPSTHLLAGAYFDPWETRLEILDQVVDRVEVLLSFQMDDPRYCESRSRPTGVSCRTWLELAAMVPGA